MPEGRKFNIALLSSGLGHVKRGVETWTAEMATALNAKGVNCTVYKGGGKKEAVYERVIPCLRRYSGLNKWVIKHRPGFMWRFGFGTIYTLEEMTFAWNILPELLTRQFDIIHTQDPDIALFIQRLHKLRLIKSKVILAHGTEEPFDFLKKIDYLQHLAPFHQEQANENGVVNKKSFAMGNFINTDLFKPADQLAARKALNIPGDAFVVLSVAAIKKTHKRIDYLIDEVKKIRATNVHLVIAGAETIQTEDLIQQGKEALEGRITFLKNYPRENIHQVYTAADIFVLCSLKEMMPIALLEAISSGLPSIVHHYPVEKWMIGDGGESIDMAKKGELALTIGKYLSDDYRREKSRNAREHAVRNFSKDVIVNQIIAMYDSVLKND